MTHHQTLTDALHAQEQHGVGAYRPTREQSDAIDALLKAFGTNAHDVAGFASIAGHPLLVIARIGDPDRSLASDTSEIRELLDPWQADQCGYISAWQAAQRARATGYIPQDHA